MEWKGRKQKRTGPWRKPLCQKQSMRALSPGAKTGMKGQGIAPAPSTEWQCKQESKPGHCNRETLKASWCNTIKAHFLLTGQPHTDTAAWGRSSKWLSRYPGSCHLVALPPATLGSQVTLLYSSRKEKRKWTTTALQAWAWLPSLAPIALARPQLQRVTGTYFIAQCPRETLVISSILPQALAQRVISREHLRANSVTKSQASFNENWIILHFEKSQKKKKNLREAKRWRLCWKQMMAKQSHHTRTGWLFSKAHSACLPLSACLCIFVSVSLSLSTILPQT